jgi:hypothetical protein
MYQVLYPTVDKDKETIEQKKSNKNKQKSELRNTKLQEDSVISYCNTFDYVFVSLNRLE